MKHARVVDAADLGRAAREARITKGIDQAELAARMGVSRMTISRLERGENVSQTTAIRALSECGYRIEVLPKLARIEVHNG